MVVFGSGPETLQIGRNMAYLSPQALLANRRTTATPLPWRDLLNGRHYLPSVGYGMARPHLDIPILKSILLGVTTSIAIPYWIMQAPEISVAVALDEVDVQGLQ